MAKAGAFEGRARAAARRPTPPRPAPDPQDDMADLMDAQAEIQEVMGQTFATPDGLDEDDLLGELDALDAELAAEGAAATDAGPSYLADDPSELPAAPAGAVPVAAGGGDGFGLPEAPQKN